jgi:hypothetical protein
MFKITSTQPINWSWASFALVKGENTFPSRQSVPTELWPKLKRFRDLDILKFESEFDDDGKLVAHESDKIVLEQLSELQLFQMSKADLAELAKANSINVAPAEGLTEPSKKSLIEALVAKLPKPEPEPEPGGVTVDPTGGDKAVVTNKRGAGKPVTSSTEIKS